MQLKQLQLKHRNGKHRNGKLKKRKLFVLWFCLLFALAGLSEPFASRVRAATSMPLLGITGVGGYWKQHRESSQTPELTPTPEATPAPGSSPAPQSTPAPGSSPAPELTPAPDFSPSSQQQPAPGTDPQSGSQTDTQEPQEPPFYNTTIQLTEDDIFQMNGGDAAVLYSNGCLTFLRGRFYDQKVTNQEDAIEALQGVAALLGLTKGSEFYCVFVEQSPSGYMFYTYQQRYGDITLENAVLKVIVDPQGYTAGLVSSFTPYVGIAPEEESSITPEEALEIVREIYRTENFTFYPEFTRQTSVTIGGVAYHAWAVFTDGLTDVSQPDGRNFLEHLVGYDGTYFMYTPVSSPQDLVLGDNAQAELAASWFDGLRAAEYTGTVTLHDGSTTELTVPVAVGEDGTYYLADPERHILLADCYRFLYDRWQIVPYTSADNTGWPEHYLLFYDSYRKIYDFFASIGCPSIDGFGMPILILCDYCDRYGSPVNNACFLGMSGGWAVFGASAVNDFGEALDVAGHEFTHGITTYSMAGSAYANGSGALNEALSDILGNLSEWIILQKEKGDWHIAESSGQIVRNMAFPWEYKQPVQIDGTFYVPETEKPAYENDYGGIHTNSGIVGHIAWELCSQGLGASDSVLLWLDAIRLITPYSSYREIHQALLFAAEMRGLDAMWLGRIEMACELAGI